MTIDGFYEGGKLAFRSEGLPAQSDLWREISSGALSEVDIKPGIVDSEGKLSCLGFVQPGSGRTVLEARELCP